VHVTLRARIAPLRSQHVFPTVRLALLRAARRQPERFRLLQFSVQRDHVHLIVEAADARALSSGVRSVAIRVARYVNDLLGRRGPLWADRWHGRALATPREVRHALAYVLCNFRKHAAQSDARRRAMMARAGSASCVRAGVDPYSSGEWFDGWRGWKPASGVAPPFAVRPAWPTSAAAADGTAAARVVSEPTTWLAAVGWRRYGLVALDESPRAG
jgi:REP element-mobilizing transposase RayT